MSNWLAEQLVLFREQYNQTPEGIAILLNMDVEEYKLLESGVIPDDSLIRLICQLFEWNYNEVQQNLRKQSGAQLKDNSAKKTKEVKATDVSNLIKKSREKVGQTYEGMALLLDIDEAEYISLENGETPGDPLLKKLCQVFQWNYADAKKLILKTSNTRFLEEKTKEGFNLQSLNDLPKAMEGLSFGEILLQARLKQGATLEALALLLNIEEDELAEYEAGEIPGEEMLKKICSLFEWNYNDILSHLRNIGFSSFPGAKIEKPKPNARFSKIQELCTAIQGEALDLQGESLKFIEIQLKLIQQTIREVKRGV